MYKQSYKTLKTEKQFLKIVCANVISRFGDSIDLIAFQWIAFQLTGSAVWIAIITGINYIPNLIFMPFAGVLVERINKKRVMVICDIIRGIITLSLVLLLYFDFRSPWMLIIITFANSTCESFRVPAGMALRPNLIAKERYTLGIALDQSLSRIVELAGFAMAGFIVAFNPILAVVLDSITFFTSAVIIATVSHKEKMQEYEKSLASYKKSFVDGIKYIGANKIVLYLSLWGALANIPSAALMSFKTIYVADTLKLEVWVLSFISVASTVGMIIGALIAPKIENKLKVSHLLAICGVVDATVYIMLATIPGAFSNQWIVIAAVSLAMFVNGVSLGSSNIIYSTTLIKNIDDDYRSRVGGVFGALITGSIPVSAFIIAGLSSFMTIPQIFMISAVLCIVTYCWVLIPKELKDI